MTDETHAPESRDGGNELSDSQLEQLLYLSDDHLPLPRFVSIQLGESEISDRERRHLSVCPKCRRRQGEIAPLLRPTVAATTALRPSLTDEQTYSSISTKRPRTATTVVVVAVLTLVVSATWIASRPFNTMTPVASIQPPFSIKITADRHLGDGGQFPSRIEVHVRPHTAGAGYLRFLTRSDGALLVENGQVDLRSPKPFPIETYPGGNGQLLWIVFSEQPIAQEDLQKTLDNRDEKITAESTGTEITNLLEKKFEQQKPKAYSPDAHGAD